MWHTWQDGGAIPDLLWWCPGTRFTQ